MTPEQSKRFKEYFENQIAEFDEQDRIERMKVRAAKGHIVTPEQAAERAAYRADAPYRFLEREYPKLLEEYHNLPDSQKAEFLDKKIQPLVREANRKGVTKLYEAHPEGPMPDEEVHNRDWGTPEEIEARSKAAWAEAEKERSQRPRSGTFATRERPLRGKRMEKLSGRLRAARMKGGRTGQVLELASALGDRAVRGRGAGLLPGKVGMLRGLGGLGALAALGYFGGKMGYDILHGETNLFGPSERNQALANLAGQGSAQQYEEAARARRMVSAMENQRMQQSIMENLQQVAQNNPALYNQVSAGRKLPRGAVVLGGQQRQDLLTELARAMDSGSFRQQDPLSELIG
jgi:hypothetical protein